MSTPNTRVHPVVKQQYYELIQVWEESVRSTHHFLSESDILRYKPLILEQYFDQLNLFCVKDNRKILGFIGIKQDLIQMLFIHPAARGSGFGKMLVKYAIETYQVNSVDVNEQNQQAVGFYEHLGFTTVERFDHDAAGMPYPILSMTLNTAIRG